jgi:asparagine synthase (glutamine-hydrolysing)
MFAFALWDALEEELWLARDPYGIKPLYVAESQGAIWFASQARALSNCAPINTKREPAALAGFYLWGYVPEPFSWWTNIRMLPAGHVQRIRAGRPPGRTKAYARVQEAYVDGAAQPLPPGTLHSLLLDSVRQHLPQDLPVGVFLSAGIDSSVIASLASELGAHLHTITLAFDEYAGTADDEAPLAETAANILQSNHVTARIGRDEFEEVVDDFFSCMDQPTIDGLNTYLVSRAAAKQGLKVVLSGLGGDELFGGYPSFRQIPTIMMWGRHFPFASSLGPLTERLLRRFALPRIPPKAAGLLSHSGDIARAYLLRRALYLEDELDGLLDESILTEGLERLSTIHSVTETVSKLPATCYARIAALESCWYLRNQLLRDTDWSSMSHGVEVRTPFVDTTLLRHLAPAIASDIPPTKRNLAACARFLPAAMSARPKTGFCTPVQAWTSPEGRLGRGFRGWASYVYHAFELAHKTAPAIPSSAPQTALSGRAHPGLARWSC